jgi:hypothetical protein
MKNILDKDKLDEIHIWCKRYNIVDYTISQDGSVDVQGTVHLHNKGLTHLPFKFGTINGDFNIGRNKLTNLINAPSIVDNFDASENMLTTLEGCPSKINGDLYLCNNDYLVSLYVGEYEVVAQHGIELKDCNLPNALESALAEGADRGDPNEVEDENNNDIFYEPAWMKEQNLNQETLTLFFKYQHYFGIWDNKTELNEDGLKDLMEEIKEGLI